MKAFWLKKFVSKEDKCLFRGDTIKENSIEINIKEENLFNEVIISNSNHSDCIYTVHSLQFKTKDKNTFTLFMTNDINFRDDSDLKDNLHIQYSLNNTESSSSMELCSFRTDLDNSIDLLPSNYILILPGGSIIIKLKHSIREGFINITFSIENF